MFAGNYAPDGWAFCDGQLVAINENPTLYQVIGIAYGGDGHSTFALPNLQSRVPMHQLGPNYDIGTTGGAESVTLTLQQIPAHNHPLQAANSAQVRAPTGSTILASASSTQTGSINTYVSPPPTTNNLNPATVKNDGGSQPHSNLQPYLAVNFIIALAGIYPTPN